MVNGIPVDYAEHGTGTPALALHGGGVDHRENGPADERVSPRHWPATLV